MAVRVASGWCIPNLSGCIFGVLPAHLEGMDDETFVAQVSEEMARGVHGGHIATCYCPAVSNAYEFAQRWMIVPDHWPDSGRP